MVLLNYSVILRSVHFMVLFGCKTDEEAEKLINNLVFSAADVKENKHTSEFVSCQ